MSTDYSHFSKLAFDQLFSIGPEGQERLMINSSGAFVGTMPPAGSSTGTVSVGQLLTLLPGNTASCAVTIASAGLGIYRSTTKTLGFAAGGLAAATLSSTTLSVTGTIKTANNGSGGATSIQLVTANKGFYVPTTASIGIVIGGNDLFRLRTTASRTEFIFNSAGIAGTSDIFNGVTSQAVRIAGGNTAANGGGVYLYGSTHAKPGWIEFYNSGTLTGTINSSANLVMVGTVTGSNLSGTNTGDQTITLTGTITGSGTGSISTSISNSAVTNVMVATTAAISGTKIVSASSVATGVVTTGTQTFAGQKNFGSHATVKGLLSVGGGSLGTTAIFNAAPTGTSTPLTGTNQIGYRSAIVGSTAGTSNVTGFDAQVTTVASAYTCGMRAQFKTTATNKGAGSTITRDVGLLFSAIDQGTNNAYIADNTSFTGNWFINQANAGDSQFVGAVTIKGDTTNTSLAVDSSNVVTIGSGSTPKHKLNTLLATNGSQTATLTNLPAAATSGDPNGWISITINGTQSYIPFWH